MKPQEKKYTETLTYLLDRIPYLNNDIFKEIAMKTMNYYKGSKTQKQHSSLFQQLELDWYNSLEKNEPVYSYYSKPEMVIETWCCFHLYSKKYLDLIKKLNFDKSQIKTITDIGCGVGFSTSYLKDIFPNADVYGTNVRGTQFDIATELGQKNNFKIIDSVNELDKIDLIFASEYFEHFEKPIEHLKEVLNKKPKMLIIANAFGSKSFGHFNTYYHNDKAISNKTIGRLFNQALKFYGYKLVKTGFWNNRPNVWILDKKNTND